MKSAEEYKKELRSLLPENAFLKTDRGQALFVTDAPRRKKDFILQSIDFETDEIDGLLYITPSLTQYPEALRPLILSCVKYGIESRQKEIRSELALGMRRHSETTIELLKSMIIKTEVTR